MALRVVCLVVYHLHGLTGHFKVRTMVCTQNSGLVNFVLES